MGDRALARVLAKQGTPYPCAQSTLDRLLRPQSRTRKGKVSIATAVSQAVAWNDPDKFLPGQLAAKQRLLVRLFRLNVFLIVA